MPEPKSDVVYALIVMAAIAAGMIARRVQPEPPVALGRLQKLAISLGALIGGALGAKLPYVLADPAGAVSGLAWLRDGRTITWGLVGGYFGVELAKWLAGVKGKTGDGFAIPVAVSFAVGRLACFYAGCCYGAETTLPWGVDFGDGVPRHPNQIYESIFHASMALVLWQLAKRRLLRFQRIKLYILSYMLFRFVAELWRPEPRLALGLTFYQWSAAAFALLFAGLFWLDARRKDLRLAGATDPAG